MGRKPNRIPQIGADDIARFWSFVDRKAPTDCWLWRSYMDIDGRGRFNIKGVEYKAPRIAYFLTRNVDLGHLNANHSCDTPACCNPAHLWSGTQQDGMKDMKVKRRNAKGSKHGNARLTEEQIRWIRKSTHSGRLLARMLGVSEATISRVRSRRWWRHVV